MNDLIKLYQRAKHESTVSFQNGLTWGGVLALAFGLSWFVLFSVGADLYRTIYSLPADTHVPAVSILKMWGIIIVSCLALGVFLRNSLGRGCKALVEKIVESLPGVGFLYGFAKGQVEAIDPMQVAEVVWAINPQTCCIDLGVVRERYSHEKLPFDIVLVSKAFRASPADGKLDGIPSPFVVTSEMNFSSYLLYTSTNYKGRPLSSDTDLARVSERIAELKSKGLINEALFQN